MTKTRRGRKSENNAEIRVRLSAKTKDKAEKIFREQGLSTGDGVRHLIDRAIAEKDPWFAHNTSSHIPNAETEEAMRECLDGPGEAVPESELDDWIMGKA